MDDSYANFIKQFLEREHHEALGWLRAASSSPSLFRTLGEMDSTESIALVSRIYAVGAEAVLAVEIDEYPGGGANTGHLLGRLPPDKAKRAKLFAFESEQAESQGFDGTPDEGQEYVYLKLD